MLNGEVSQKSLFPDSVEVLGDALEALEDLELQRGFEYIDQARRLDPSLGNLDAIESALRWLRTTLGDPPPNLERAAAAFLDLPAAGLSPGAVSFADSALARYGLRHAQGAFLDAGERVHVGALRLVLGHFAMARRALDISIEEDRANLWGWRGDACVRADRSVEANECYVRALILDASAVDLFRLHQPRLAELYAELLATHPESCARELLLPNAWMRGLLHIAQGNEWLTGHIARLRARTAVTGNASDAEQLRRFTFLFYLDRSRPPDAVSLDERGEMAGLAPELFRSVLAVLRKRER